MSIIKVNLRLAIGGFLAFHDQIAAADPELGITFAPLNAITRIGVLKRHNALV